MVSCDGSSLIQDCPLRYGSVGEESTVPAEAAGNGSECGGRILFSVWRRKRRKLSNQ